MVVTTEEGILIGKISEVKDYYSKGENAYLMVKKL